MSQPSGDLSDVEKQRRLAELQRRLTGQRLPEDFTNGATETVLLRYLAARGFDVDKALAVRTTLLLPSARLWARDQERRAGRRARGVGRVPGASVRWSSGKVRAHPRRDALLPVTLCCAQGCISRRRGVTTHGRVLVRCSGRAEHSLPTLCSEDQCLRRPAPSPSALPLAR
jgi:hypothetical protein